MNQPAEVVFNAKAHNSVYKKYERIHPEIFNSVEQERLRSALSHAVSEITSTENKPKALDIGCGSGNLSRHLSELGCEVTAADISEHFLRLVTDTVPGVCTHTLNGTDLSEIADDSFDIVATYSVLHHIPDYLKMVSEMCRVLKPGGVLYIDHEKNENFWNNESKLQEFYAAQKRYLLPSKLGRLLNPMWYVHRVRRIKNPRYQAEGDIHVWPDDHIEWEEVYKVCKSHNVAIIKIDDFLLSHAEYDQTVFAEYKDKVTDTRAALFKKHD